MRFDKIALNAMLGLSLVAMPVVSHASALPLSLTNVDLRAGAPVDDESALGGGFIIPLIALVAVIVGIVVVTNDEDDEDESVSP